METFESYPTLWVQTGEELCSRINFLFAKRYLSRFVLRITGGCSYMDGSDAGGLHNLRAALRGYAGVGLFGGTNIRKRCNPAETVDSICEIFPSLTGPMLRLGVVAKTEDMRVTPYGLVVHDQPGNDTFAVMHPGADALLAIQPSADRHAPFEREFKECVRIVSELQQSSWGSLLLVYNGGQITEKEARTWAELGKREPGRWPVLLVKGSGRTADKLAADPEFSALPGVHCCEMDSDSLKASFKSFNVPFKE